MEIWKIYGKKADFFENAEKFNIDPVVARVIRNRDLINDEDIEMFLRGTKESMYSPWLFEDMEKAVSIINDNIRVNNKIRIISDYDADGVCSGFILLDFFKKVGAVVSIAIPDRIQDGYGINNDLIDKAYADGINLIITCDNGIAAGDTVEYAKSLGMKVIVTDHHEVPYKEIDGVTTYMPPKADAILNQKMPECNYPFKDICGAGVAYKLVCAYAGRYADDRLVSKIDTDYYIQFAAIATVCDIVSLKDENRILVKQGIKQIKKAENIGLEMLIDSCGLNKNAISSYHFGFVIGPCINASGRLDSARRAVELFMERDRAKARIIAEELVALNNERKNLTENYKKTAVEMAEKISDKVLVIHMPDCHESIAGIVAGKVKDKYYKPTIVFTGSEENIKASARSIEAYNMYEALNKCSKYMVKFGGHKMAAGLTIKKENLKDFRKDINEQCILTKQDMTRVVWIDTMLPLDYISEKFINDLTVLEPFGNGNTKPVFAESKVKVKHIRVLGSKRNVLKFQLVSKAGRIMDGTWFGDADENLEKLKSKFGEEEIDKSLKGNENNILLDFIYYPVINEFRGVRNIQINIINIKI